MERFEVLKALNMSNNLSQMATDANTKSERYMYRYHYSLGNKKKYFQFLNYYLRICDQNSHTLYSKVIKTFVFYIFMLICKKKHQKGILIFSTFFWKIWKKSILLVAKQKK